MVGAGQREEAGQEADLFSAQDLSTNTPGPDPPRWTPPACARYLSPFGTLSPLPMITQF